MKKGKMAYDINEMIEDAKLEETREIEITRTEIKVTEQPVEPQVTIREVKKPVIVKLSPNVTNVVEMAKAVESAGADAISLINTLVGMRINLRTGEPIISIKKGGYSGPGIYPVALRMIYEVSHAVNIPIIGMGGVSNAYEVLEMMYAGASLIMVGAQNLVDPYVCEKIINDLPNVMKEYNIENLQDIIGRAK